MKRVIYEGGNIKRKFTVRNFVPEMPSFETQN